MTDVTTFPHVRRSDKETVGYLRFDYPADIGTQITVPKPAPELHRTAHRAEPA